MAIYDIYTDGGAEPNPGLGGWGAVILEDGQLIKQLQGSQANTSNNRMELTAAIEALKVVTHQDLVTLYTDSNYVRQGITNWIERWKYNGWRTANRKPVKNQDLWILLDELSQQRQITWHWVKGHGGDQWNEYVDQLVWQARQAAA